MITFRSKKYKSEINCTFYANNGPQLDNLSHYLIGDKITIIFDVPIDVAEAINSNLSDSSGIRAISVVLDKDEWAVHIPFRVVDRRHSFSWEKVGNLRTLGTSICLEAESGYWEDVFLWVCCNEIPRWAA